MKGIKDQFQSYVMAALGRDVHEKITKPDMIVLENMFFAGYRCCYETIQHATALPSDEATEKIMRKMVEDLAEYFPGSARLATNPEGGAPKPDEKLGIKLSGPLGLVDDQGNIRPFGNGSN